MPAPRQRPGVTSPQQSKTIAKPDTKSRQKAEQGVKSAQATQEIATDEGPQFSPDGFPLARIMFGASELIPTGNFANVTLGPCVVTLWHDPRVGDIPEEHLANIVQANNQLAYTVLRDILAVQRNIVLENLEDDNSDD